MTVEGRGVAGWADEKTKVCLEKKKKTKVSNRYVTNGFEVVA